MLMVAPGDRAIGERLAEELAEVETRFAAELLSDLPCVNSLVAHVERYRGKMLRPMLVLVSGMASAKDQSSLTDAHRVIATVVEMVHMATLVHDDILDEAQVRRRGSTINHLRGNEAAVMLGDYLISHAYHLCSSLPVVPGAPVPSRVIADATNTVCEGELLQLANRENWSLDEQTYFEIIRRKTASLCGTCCRLGALLSDADLGTADGLYDYGEKLGVAFQIVDDLLDLTGTQDTVGKTLGRDIDKGKLTLPLIHNLKSAGSRRGEMLRVLEPSDGNGNGHDQQHAAILELLRGTDSLDYANAVAGRLVQSARESVASLPDSPARALLLEMADAVVTRKF
jgi:octaprenyl-diphosphate synthase